MGFLASAQVAAVGFLVSVAVVEAEAVYAMVAALVEIAEAGVSIGGSTCRRGTLDGTAQ